MVTAQQTTTANVVKTQPPVQDNGSANGNGKAAEQKTVGAMDGAGEQEKVYTGKQHHWALAPTTRINHDTIINLIPTIGVIILTAYINSLPITSKIYTTLNARYTPFDFNFYGTLILSTGTYWILGLIFMLFDMTPLHSLVASYKIQPQRRITWAEYRRVLTIVARNTLCVNVPLSFAVAYFDPLDSSPNLPGWWTTTWVYFFCLACEEAGFYFVHRAVHAPRWYAKVHKMHHQFTAPVAFASTYCTMTEHLFSNLLPIVLGLVIIRPHWSLMIMFFCSLEIGTLCTHSDYNIPGLYDALQHDWHHYSFTENFGPTGLIDDVLGTNKQFKVWLSELKRRDVAAGVGKWGRKAARAELAEATPEA